MELKRAELLRSTEENAVKCWPEHWHAWRLFAALSTQWQIHYPALGGKPYYERLRYELLDIVEPRILPDIEEPDRKSSAELFMQLRILEGEALRHLNAR